MDEHAVVDFPFRPLFHENFQKLTKLNLLNEQLSYKLELLEFWFNINIISLILFLTRSLIPTREESNNQI